MNDFTDTNMTRKIYIGSDIPMIDTECVDPHDRELQQAVGYLSIWAYGSKKYRDAKLWVDCEKNVTANYFDENGKQTYLIFGKRDEYKSKVSYSFHS